MQQEELCSILGKYEINKCGVLKGFSVLYEY